MSQYFEKYKSLEEIVKLSPAIVIAKPIKEKDKYSNSDRFQGFKILEILLDRKNILKLDLKIFVFPGDYGLWLEMSNHLKKHGMQGMPSPEVPAYKTNMEYEGYKDADKCIIFIRPIKEGQNRFEFVAEKAYEDVKMKDKVVKLIKENPLRQGREGNIPS